MLINKSKKFITFFQFLKREIVTISYISKNKGTKAGIPTLVSPFNAEKMAINFCYKPYAKVYV